MCSEDMIYLDEESIDRERVITNEHHVQFLFVYYGNLVHVVYVKIYSVINVFKHG